MTDWLHCNGCYALPSDKATTIYLSDCNHLFCQKCLKKAHTACGVAVPPCSMCKSVTRYHEVNSRLRPEKKRMFQDPSKMLNEFFTRDFKPVSDFQSCHRTHLQKHLRDKTNRAVKLLKEMQTELAKKEAHEKMLTAEFLAEKANSQQLLAQNNDLRAMLAQKEQEERQRRQIQQQSAQMPSHRSAPWNLPMNTLHGVSILSPVPNLSGSTPVLPPSFNCVTSTPVDRQQPPKIDKQQPKIDTQQMTAKRPRTEGRMRFKDIFATPFFGEDAPISGGGLNYGQSMNTPSMLGLRGANRDDHNRDGGDIDGSRFM